MWIRIRANLNADDMMCDFMWSHLAFSNWRSENRNWCSSCWYADWAPLPLKWREKWWKLWLVFFDPAFPPGVAFLLEPADDDDEIELVLPFKTSLSLSFRSESKDSFTLLRIIWASSVSWKLWKSLWITTIFSNVAVWRALGLKEMKF